MIKIFYISINECEGVVVDDDWNITWGFQSNAWQGKVVKEYKYKNRVIGYDVAVNR